MEPTRLNFELSYLFLLAVNHQQLALVTDVSAVLPETSKIITIPVPLALSRQDADQQQTHSAQRVCPSSAASTDSH